jgi:uncharacterized protein Yka (UPF0111/DUF47 family)
MTKKELSQLYHLRGEMEDDMRRLARLREEALAPVTSDLSGMPKGSSDLSRIERYAEQIDEIQRRIDGKLEAIAQERFRLATDIADQEDTYIRRLLVLRFIEGLTWNQIAHRVHSTADAVRKTVDRWIRKNK